MKTNLEWYYNPTFDKENQSIIKTNEIRSSNIEIDSLNGELIFDKNANNLSEFDAKNSQKVYQSYQNLTPVQATDPRIWVYLSHTECKNYITRRWLSKHIPSDNKKQTLEINHFFLPGKNVRDKFVVNAVSRLWWFGYLANQVAPEEPELFLRVIFSQQDVAHQIITRSITSNINLLRSIYSVMIEGWHNEHLLKRDPMRNWMKKINFFGGVILLDSLPNSVMKSKFREFAKEALLENS